MDKTTKSRVRFVLVSVGLVVSFVGAQAAFLKIKDPNNSRPEKIDFGTLSGSSSFCTSTQCLEITHTGASFRRIYLYTDNRSAFGIPRSGLVSLTGGMPIPLSFINYETEPLPESVRFGSSEGWSLLLDISSPDFQAQRELSHKLQAGSGNKSWVYLGIELPVDARLDRNYSANLVVEDWSDAAEVRGPSVSHPYFSSLILTGNSPIGFLLNMTEESGLSNYSLHYRLTDSSTEEEEAQGAPPTRLGPMEYRGEIRLNPTFTLRAPATLDYFFVAQDIYINLTETPHYQMKLVPSNGTASVSYPVSGGTVGVAVGDPRQAGVSVSFPAGSLRSGGTLLVGLRDAASFPKREMDSPTRVFRLEPANLNLSRPATLSLPFLDQDGNGREDVSGVKETDLRVYWYDGFTWRYVGGQVDPQNNTVSANVMKLGNFALFSKSGAPSVEQIRPLERILTPRGNNAALTFNTAVSDGAFDIEIVDVRGTVVRKLHNNNVWDGRDEGGSLVESGTYVYRFEGQGVTFSGMVAVAR